MGQASSAASVNAPQLPLTVRLKIVSSLFSGFFQILLQKFAGDDYPLDLVGSFEDLRELGIAHHPLDRIIHRIAVTAEDLDGVGVDLHGHVPASAFRHACQNVYPLPAA